jgi:uncharacterized protein YbaR (Trm112 family)
MSENLSEEILALLRCPETGQALKLARADELEALGANFPEGGLLTEDGRKAYPVQDGFPVLKAEDCVTLSDVPSSETP